MKCTQEPTLQNHQIRVFSFHEVACTTRQINQKKAKAKWVRPMQRPASQISSSQSLPEDNLLGPSLITDTPPLVTATHGGCTDMTCTPPSIHGKFLLCLWQQTQGPGALCNQNEHPGKEAWIKAWWLGGSILITHCAGLVIQPPFAAHLDTYDLLATSLGAIHAKTNKASFLSSL